MERSYASPVDEALPDFVELLEARIPGPVAAVYEAAGTTVDSISRVQCTWSPGRRSIFRYRISGSNGGLAGRHDLVVVIGSVPEEAAVVEGPNGRVAAWVVPNDPLLPGLRSALHLPSVARLLSELGSDDEVAHARLRAYRPGRRAVVQVAAGASSIFLKVVPPSEVDALHDKHRFLSGFLPVPDSLGVSRDLGVVAMRALRGTDLRSILRSGGSPPHALSIARVVEDLPDPRPEWRARSPLATLPGVVDLLGRLLPEESQRLNRLAAAISPGAVLEEVPVHGDFHEAQILVESRRPVGIIDVDTFGWGHPGDDAATMLGHLHLLAPGCENPGSVFELAASLNRHWDAFVEPVSLRLRTAAVVLGLATGPFRVQRPGWREETLERMSAAEKWVESARRVDERDLIPASATSHGTVEE